VGGGHVSWFASPGIPRAIYQGGAVVQPDGRFVIEGLAEDSYRLVHETLGSLPHVVVVKVAGERTTVALDLPTGRIEGRLIGRTPKPRQTGIGAVGSIRVWPEGFPPKLPRNSGCFTEAEPDGRFTVEHLPPGRYTMTGYGLATTVTVAREGEVVNGTLRPPEKTGEIAGAVKGLPAKPERLEVYLVSAFPKDGDGYLMNDWTRQATVEPKSGAYRLRDLAPGTYGVLVSSGSGEPMPVVWVPGVEVRQGLSRDLTIEVPQGRAVEVVTEDRQSLDRASPSATGWRLKMPSGDWLDQSALPEPLVLPPGEYTIEVAYAGRGVVARKFKVEAGEAAQRVEINPAATDAK
jgi:hypothetical protein